MIILYVYTIYTLYIVQEVASSAHVGQGYHTNDETKALCPPC